MPPNEQRRPFGSGAAASFAAGELPQRSPTDRDNPDPIADLIARLEAAAAAGGPTSLGGRARVRVRRVAGGYAVERGP
jgi:hypothetical protein